MLWTKMWKSGTRWRPQSKRLPALFLSLFLAGGTFLSGCSSQGILQAGALESGSEQTEAVQAENVQEEAGSQDDQRGDSQDELSVTYLDVGQGNAVLARQGDQAMLIDGGPRESSSFVVSYLEQQGIQKLDYVLISHFDEDHLAGAIGALYKFPVETLITADYETDSSIYDSYKEAVEEKGYEPVNPSLKDTFSLGSGSFRIISPVSYGHEDENQDSVGIILERRHSKKKRKAEGNP